MAIRSMHSSFDSGASGGAPVPRRQHEARTAAPTVIVGLGNEIAGDDGVGIHVARLLGERLAESSDVDVVALPWAGLALLDILRGRQTAVIVDCLTSDARPPGTVVRLDQEGIAGSVRLNSFHDISFPTAIAFGRKMGWEMPTQIAIWGVEAAIVDTFFEGLSPAVEAAIEPLIREVLEFIEPAVRGLATMGATR
ncbi:MAG: hypothetical protein A2Z12_01565 [Actinobacteria bacterium RBG_16_68_21]|nr:MAG: hypothetical protein A2Z12_01565 [Actinobacteria bacterium RBG_16_68_21]